MLPQNYNFILKGTAVVISRVSLFMACTILKSTLKALSGQEWIRFKCLSIQKLINSDLGFFVKVTCAFL